MKPTPHPTTFNYQINFQLLSTTNLSKQQEKPIAFLGQFCLQSSNYFKWIIKVLFKILDQRLAKNFSLTKKSFYKVFSLKNGYARFKRKIKVSHQLAPAAFYDVLP